MEEREEVTEADREDEEDRPRHPRDAFKDVSPSPLPPIAPDGGPALEMIGPPEPIPAATPDIFVCLRGPCRHYWEIVTPFEAGNPKGTFDELGVATPRQILRTCLAQPGRETDLTDTVVFECNRWEPLEAAEIDAIESRRRRYYERFPEHEPDAVDDEDLDDLDPDSDPDEDAGGDQAATEA